MASLSLCRPKNWRDLMTDEEFARKDIITLLDPAAPEKQNFVQFHHVKNQLKVISDGVS